MKTRSAKGTKGLLLAFNDKPVLRVYHGKNFTDYDILHADMFIEILDDDAVFRNEGTDTPYIDYSDETLGYK